MLRRLGYVASALTIGASASRTCRLKNATPERLRELIAANLGELERMLRFNVENRIFLYRISSQIIPFGSHAVNQLAWWDEFAPTLARLGDFIARHGLRVSMHPGQFTVLNSLNPRTVAESIRELEYHARVLDALGTGPSCKLVLHVGGAADGREPAADRFAAVAGTLPEAVSRRLVIENDERVFSTEEVLALSRRTGLPVVFDGLHDRIRSGRTDGASRFLEACFATWRPVDGPPKVHFSTQAPEARPGAHADWADPDEFAAFLAAAAPARRAFDCMLEVKQKDRALFRLRDDLRALGLGEEARQEVA